MTHTSQVIKSGITLFSSSIFINIFLIGFGIYFAHVLPKKEMAVFAVYGLLAGIVNILAWLGMNDTIFKNVPELVAKKNIKKASSLTKYALCVKISVVFLLSLLLFIFAKQVSVVFLKTETFSSLMRLVSVAVFMEAVSRTFDPVARSLQIFNKFAMIKIV